MLVDIFKLPISSIKLVLVRIKQIVHYQSITYESVNLIRSKSNSFFFSKILIFVELILFLFSLVLNDLFSGIKLFVEVKNFFVFLLT